MTDTHIKMERKWAMPNQWTFKIKPIAELIKRYTIDGKGWVDPFAGKYSPAEYRNDLNPEIQVESHLDATEFLKRTHDYFDGGFYDPPYSLRQIVECYKGFGQTVDKKWATTKFNSDVKTLLADRIKPNGFAISCGWNSIGLGKARGFKIIEILLVSHGGSHNDTIITVEQKKSPFDDKE